MVLLIPFVFLAVASAYDLRKHEIPDWISWLLFGWAVVGTAASLFDVGWLGLVAGLGMGLAFGMVLFWLGGLGGGDVKLIAALGAALGPGGLLQTLFWMAMAGGVMALVALAMGKRYFAYVPAITFGFAAYVLCSLFP